MSAQDRSVRNSVCLNHPERPAASRCTVCFKPVCAECAILGDGGSFCSPQCLANFDHTRGNVASWREQGVRERARRRRARLFKLVVLIAVGVAAYLYFTRHPGQFDQVKGKARRAINEVRKGVGK